MAVQGSRTALFQPISHFCGRTTTRCACCNLVQEGKVGTNRCEDRWKRHTTLSSRRHGGSHYALPNGNGTSVGANKYRLATMHGKRRNWVETGGCSRCDTTRCAVLLSIDTLIIKRCMLLRSWLIFSLHLFFKFEHSFLCPVKSAIPTFSCLHEKTARCCIGRLTPGVTVTTTTTKSKEDNKQTQKAHDRGRDSRD